MDIIELCLKELQIACERYQAEKEALDKSITAHVTICVALAAFIVKGELPQHAYLLLAAVGLFTALRVGGMSLKKSIASAIRSSAEDRLRLWCKAHHPEAKKIFRLRIPKMEVPYFNRLAVVGRYMLVSLGACVYGTCVYFGAEGLPISETAKTGIWVLAAGACLYIGAVLGANNQCLRRAVANEKLQIEKERARLSKTGMISTAPALKNASEMIVPESGDEIVPLV